MCQTPVLGASEQETRSLPPQSLYFYGAIDPIKCMGLHHWICNLNCDKGFGGNAWELRGYITLGFIHCLFYFFNKKIIEV